jgi:hypothetical protein
MTSLENGVLKILQDRFVLTVPTCSHAGAEDASPWLWIPVVMDPRGYGSPWLSITGRPPLVQARCHMPRSLYRLAHDQSYILAVLLS